MKTFQEFITDAYSIRLSESVDQQLNWDKRVV